MRLQIGAVGRLKDGPEAALFDRYAGRVSQLGKSVGIGPLSTFELSEDKARSEKERMDKEARGLMKKVHDGAHIVALDESGSSMNTADFASYLSDKRMAGCPGISFLLGGADGHGFDVKSTSKLLSLSPMTLPHGLARIVLAEQLYRALTILSGHPYHRR